MISLKELDLGIERSGNPNIKENIMLPASACLVGQTGSDCPNATAIDSSSLLFGLAFVVVAEFLIVFLILLSSSPVLRSSYRVKMSSLLSTPLNNTVCLEPITMSHLLVPL